MAASDEDLGGVDDARGEALVVDALERARELDGVAPDDALGHVHVLRLEAAVAAERRRARDKVLLVERVRRRVVVVREDDGCAGGDGDRRHGGSGDAAPRAASRRSNGDAQESPNARVVNASRTPTTFGWTMRRHVSIELNAWSCTILKLSIRRRQ